MLWWSLSIALIALGLGTLGTLGFIAYVIVRYLDPVLRIFQEKPLFIIPRGQPLPDSEDVRFTTADGLTLAGSYVRTTAPERIGTILFGAEFGSNRWSCQQYCAQLLANGFDVFTFDFRNHGESEALPGYEPLQWVSTHEVRDVQAAVAYLKQRLDHDPEGIGFFGISRGGGAGIIAASRDPWIRCVATDGAFATRTTMIPYMKKWVEIYAKSPWLVWMLPHFVYVAVARYALRKLRKERRTHYPSMEKAIGRLSPRPLFMIHGEKDTYIKPAIARDLFALARAPKEFWLVAGAKHNQALHVAGEAYHAQLIEFFQQHLAPSAVPEPVLPLTHNA
jgi:pimeloyl-ACP methyl ester carboxylesterase